MNKFEMSVKKANEIVDYLLAENGHIVIGYPPTTSVRCGDSEGMAFGWPIDRRLVLQRKVPFSAWLKQAKAVASREAVDWKDSYEELNREGVFYRAIERVS